MSPSGLLYSLPPVGRVALRLDAHRDARVTPLLSARRGAARAVREALDTLRETADDDAASTVQRHARELLAELRDDTPPGPGLRAAHGLDARLRSEAVELLDRDDFPEVLKAPTMLGLHWVNVALGAYPAWSRCVDETLGDKAHARLYDLAAGTGGFARWLARHPPRGRRLDVTSSDRDARYVAAGARAADRDRGAVRFETRDALDLRALRAARSVDLFLCTQAVHHLHPGQVVQLTAQCIAAAPGGLLAIDLNRSVAAAAGAAAMVGALAPWPVLIYDGVLSARRAYTPAELRLLALLAGATHADARPLGPVHLQLHAHGDGDAPHF
jgi:SAM-dependent methyltransferase